MLKLLSLRAQRNVRRERNTARRGTTAIEFALIAPIFIFFLMGIIELSLVFLVQHVFESTVFNASRTAKTGYVEANMTQEETVRAALNARLGGLGILIDPNLVVIRTQTYGALPDLATPNPGTTATLTLGPPSDVLVMTISYPWTFFTPIVGDVFEDSPGTRIKNIQARMVVLNEPDI